MANSYAICMEIIEAAKLVPQYNHNKARISIMKTLNIQIDDSLLEILK